MRVSMTWPQYRRRQCVVGGQAVALDHPEGHARPLLQIEVLSALLMRCDKSTSMDELIEAVYPDDEPEYAQRCIRAALRVFRRKLPGAILTRPGFGYAVNSAI